MPDNPIGGLLALIGAFILGGIVIRIIDEIFFIAPLRQRIEELERKVYQLEQAYSELRAGYTISQSRIEELERQVKELWEVTSRIPELRKRLEEIYLQLVKVKNKVPRYTA